MEWERRSPATPALFGFAESRVAGDFEQHVITSMEHRQFGVHHTGCQPDVRIHVDRREQHRGTDPIGPAEARSRTCRHDAKHSSVDRESAGKLQAAPVPKGRLRQAAPVRRLCARSSRGRTPVAGHVRQRPDRAINRAYIACTVCRVHDARCDSFQGERPRPCRMSAIGNSRTCTCSRYRDGILTAV